MAVTVYTPSPALSGNDTNNNVNFRVLVRLSAASNGQLRVRYRASTAGGLNIVGAAFGKWNGTALSSTSCGMTTAPFRLTFAGSNTVNIASSGTATSDLITHTGVTLASGDWVIVTFWSTTTANQRFSSGHTTATTMFKADAATDRSQEQNITTDGGWSIIGNIQPGSAGGTNYCIDLVEANDPASGSPYTMPAAQGTLTASGQTVRLARSRKMAAVNGTLTLAGPTVNLIYSGAGPKTMPGGIGFPRIDGQAATLRRTRVMPAVQGTLTLAGQLADLDADRRTAGGLGILTLAGQTNRLSYARKPTAGKGQLTLAGPVVNLIYSGAGAKVLPAGLGFPVLSGRTAVLRYSRIMPAAVSMVTVNSQMAVLTYTAVEGDIVMPVSADVLKMAGQSAFLDVTRIPPKPMELKFGRKVYLRRW